MVYLCLFSVFLQQNVEVCAVADMREIRRPLLTQRVLPVNYFEISILVTDPKMFLKALSPLMYTHFEGGARDKKRNFLVKFFQKVPKNFFFDLFFQKFCLWRRNFGQYRVFGRARKISLVDLKKGYLILFYSSYLI